MRVTTESHCLRPIQINKDVAQMLKEANQRAAEAEAREQEVFATMQAAWQARRESHKEAWADPNHKKLTADMLRTKIGGMNTDLACANAIYDEFSRLARYGGCGGMEIPSQIGEGELRSAEEIASLLSNAAIKVI